jgi:Zn-dependent M16 (insulinase) family peptidase
MRVVRHIVSYDYLWNNIRVLGGAYGAGFVTRKAGEIFCYSYRDPSPERSLEIYKGVPAFLRQIAEGGTDLTDYIIGAVGEYDILLSPKLSAQIASDFALIGWTPDDEEEFFSGIVGTDLADLKAVADELEKLFDGAVRAVVGEREKIEKIEGISDNILTI